MRCPECKHTRYKTVKSDAYFTVRLRTLKCKECGHQWKTKEDYDQNADTMVVKVEKSAPHYNKRWRYIKGGQRMIETYEVMTDTQIQFMNLDLFAEAI